MTDTLTEPLPPSPGPWRMMWRKLLHNRVACVGGVLVILLYTCACFAGFLAPYDYADSDRNSSRAGPMLFGGHTHVSEQVASRSAPGTNITAWERAWTWWDGGLEFRAPDGSFSLRPHVHPLVERTYEDEHGETTFVPAAEDRTVLVPVEFFVETEEHEVFSLLGIPGTEIRGTRRLFGARKPPGGAGSVRVYLLGSDQQGRDIWSRLLYGARVSL